MACKSDVTAPFLLTWLFFSSSPTSSCFGFCSDSVQPTWPSQCTQWYIRMSAIDSPILKVAASSGDEICSLHYWCLVAPRMFLTQRLWNLFKSPALIVNGQLHTASLIGLLHNIHVCMYTEHLLPLTSSCPGKWALSSIYRL